MTTATAQRYAQQTREDRLAAAKERREDPDFGNLFSVTPSLVAVSASSKVIREKKPRGARINWTEEEYNLIASLYCKHFDVANQSDNRETIAFEFTKVFPERGDSPARLAVMQLKSIDNYCVVGGLKDTASGLAAAARRIDESRFS